MVLFTITALKDSWLRELPPVGSTFLRQTNGGFLGATGYNIKLEMHPSWWAARSSKPVRRRNGRRVSSILTHLRHFYFQSSCHEHGCAKKPPGIHHE